jgi:hypothetical protein
MYHQLMRSHRHPGPIVISFRQQAPFQKRRFQFLGLLFGIEPSGNPIWLVARTGTSKGLYVKAWSGQDQAFVDSSDFDLDRSYSKYVQKVVDKVERRWVASKTGDPQVYNRQMREAVTDCVIWALRRADSRLMGMRSSRPWLAEVLVDDEPVVVGVRIQEGGQEEAEEEVESGVDKGNEA